MEIKLGDCVRDRLTSAEGVVVGITQWLGDPIRVFTVQPPMLKSVAGNQEWAPADTFTLREIPSTEKTKDASALPFLG